MALTTVTMMCIVDKDCETANLKATMGLLFGLWSIIFVLLLLQAVGHTKCLRTVPKLLFGFYFFVCGVMFFTQLELFGGADPAACRKNSPALWWWLMVNVGVFYFIVSFGLATWGSYICKVADAQEEITQEAVNEYLKEKKRD